MNNICSKQYFWFTTWRWFVRSSNASRIIQNDSNLVLVLELFQQRTKTFILNLIFHGRSKGLGQIPYIEPDQKHVPRPWYIPFSKDLTYKGYEFSIWPAKGAKMQIFHLSIFCFVLRFINLIMPSYSRNSAKSGSDIYLFQLKNPWVKRSFRRSKSLKISSIGQILASPWNNQICYESQCSFNFIYVEFLAIVWFDFTFRNVVFDVFSQFWIFTVRNDINDRRLGQDMNTDNLNQPELGFGLESKIGYYRRPWKRHRKRQTV